MTLKIQAITSTDGLNVEVGKSYYVESDELAGEFKVTYLEVIPSIRTASGVDVRAEIEVPSTRAAAFTYHDVAIDCILDNAR